MDNKFDMRSRSLGSLEVRFFGLVETRGSRVSCPSPRLLHFLSALDLLKNRQATQASAHANVLINWRYKFTLVFALIKTHQCLRNTACIIQAEHIKSLHWRISRILFGEKHTLDSFA